MSIQRIASLEARLARLTSSLKQNRITTRRASASLIFSYEDTINLLNSKGLFWEDSSTMDDFHAQMKQLFWKPLGADIDMNFYLYLTHRPDKYSKLYTTTDEFLLYAKTLRTDHEFLFEYLNNLPEKDLHRFLFDRINKYAPSFFKDKKYIMPLLLTEKGLNAFVYADHGASKEYITDIRKDQNAMATFLGFWSKKNPKLKPYLKKNFIISDAI